MDQKLKEKIKGRAREAFANPEVKHHRITEVTDKSLVYRMPHEPNQGLYTGQRVKVIRDKLGRLKIVE